MAFFCGCRPLLTWGLAGTSCVVPGIWFCILPYMIDAAFVQLRELSCPWCNAVECYIALSIPAASLAQLPAFLSLPSHFLHDVVHHDQLFGDTPNTDGPAVHTFLSCQPIFVGVAASLAYHIVVCAQQIIAVAMQIFSLLNSDLHGLVRHTLHCMVSVSNCATIGISLSIRASVAQIGSEPLSLLPGSDIASAHLAATLSVRSRAPAVFSFALSFGSSVALRLPSPPGVWLSTSPNCTTFSCLVSVCTVLPMASVQHLLLRCCVLRCMPCPEWLVRCRGTSDVQHGLATHGSCPIRSLFHMQFAGSLSSVYGDSGIMFSLMSVACILFCSSRHQPVFG